MKVAHKLLLFNFILLSVTFMCRGDGVYFSDNANLMLPGSYNIPWMAGIQDFRTLSLITLPGTHDSMALYGGPEAECQALSLMNQLRAGIRFLDLKVFGLGNTLYVMHGVMYQHSTLKEVLDIVKSFLAEFSSEAVLIQVKPESFEKNTVNEMVQSLIGNDQIFYVTSGMPNMGQVRGKIVFLQKSTFTLGIPFIDTAEKGSKEVTNVKNKDNRIIHQLNQATEACGGDNEVLTYTSGTGFGTFWGMFLTPKRVAEKLRGGTSGNLLALPRSSIISASSRVSEQLKRVGFDCSSHLQLIDNLKINTVQTLCCTEYESRVFEYEDRAVSVLKQSPGAGEMSISMTNADGVTVLTLTSDPKSVWPPLCQILRALCYNPVCCTVSQQLKRERRISQSVLGTMQIMIGLLNIGLGTILLCSHVYMYLINSDLLPIWLGILVILNVMLNFAGVAFAITGIVLYSVTMGNLYLWWNCSPGDPWYSQYTTASPSPEELRIQEACKQGKEVLLILLRSIQALLLVLSVLGLCVTISSSVLGIKVLRKKEKEDTKVSLWDKAMPAVTVAAHSKDMFPSLCETPKTLCRSPVGCLVHRLIQASVTTAIGLGFTVFMNIVGAIFAITGIVLYIIDLKNASLLWMCDQSRNNVSQNSDNCRNVAVFAQKLIRSMDIALIVLAVLQLYVSIRFAILGIRALMKEKEGGKDAEEPLPQLEENKPF
ncbi:hypothetical protein EXN66_Car007958 [Channa argus]|uniref:Phosphatidylinositol-specific phospholipase C X domain-containing protein n=1 Tax=Channa argus TaxID=215402 RepID=A0A6G1PPT7_CHAAH|nr:hypothetical protein EXN66_Car007958 [Channa argus]